MSKLQIQLIVITIIGILAITGVFYGKYYYDTVDASSVPVTPIEVAGQEVLPMSAEATVPVFFGMFQKPLDCLMFDGKWWVVPEGAVFDMQDPASDLGLIGDAQYALEIKLPGAGAAIAAGSASGEGSAASDSATAVADSSQGEGSEAGDNASGEGSAASDSASGVGAGAGADSAQAAPDTAPGEGQQPAMQWSVTLAYRDESGKDTPIYMSGELDAAHPIALDEDIILKKAGSYTLSVEGRLPADDPGGLGGPAGPAGTFHYRAYFSVKNPDPVFTAGRTELEQGDLLSLKLENVEEGVVPEIESVLGPAIFTEGLPVMEEGAEEQGAPEGFTNWYAVVPINNSRAPGDYQVMVRAGELEYETMVTVSEYDFDFQNMIIDMSVPSVAAAVTGDAIAEFREKVSPLFPILSEERYWNGLFVPPVDLGARGFISTQFGEKRITNGNQSTLRSHLGMDFAVSTGTPVHASAAGMVLISEFLLNTGNTVIIDHGGGLKSIYYHMDSVEDLAGTVVEQGTLIGRVGSTGYSTGPHLHYEMRLGEQPVSPSMLFDPGAGLYSAE